MRKSTMLWVVLLALFCALVMRLRVALADLPVQLKFNWFAIIPVIAVFATLMGAIIRKESAVKEAREPKSNTELAAVR